jgi:glutaminyl-peptide cyclotransferase
LNSNVPKRIEAYRELIRWQCGFGPRHPGAHGHRPFIDALNGRLERGGLDDVLHQDFRIEFLGDRPLCTNLIGVKRAAAGRKTAGPLLIGAHFDSRARADNEADEDLRVLPIPGANDGGSGVAVLLQLMPRIARTAYTRDIHLVFFDAEDVGNIGGREFAEGAHYLAAHPFPETPGHVLVLDLVGGAGMTFDIDMHFFETPGSLAWAREIFALAEQKNFLPLLASKPEKNKAIVADHYPFHRKGIPAFIFIDIDYPEWHTLADSPSAVSGESLVMMEDFLIALLDRYRIEDSKGMSSPPSRKADCHDE